MSEVILATSSCDSAEPIRMQLLLQLRTFISIRRYREVNHKFKYQFFWVSYLCDNLLSVFLIFFECLMTKSTKEKSSKPTICSEKEFEKWHLRQSSKTVTLFKPGKVASKT